MKTRQVIIIVITQFQILTRSFGADAGKIILSEHAFPITQFIQLNLQFEKSIVKAVYDGHATQGDHVIPDLVHEYGNALLALHPPASQLVHYYKLIRQMS